MYLKNIAIKNIGPIEELNIELPFTEGGLPKPIVFVGENGSGKTVLQSQIIDAFYEIGSDLFDDVGSQAGLKRNYYKISGGLNLQTGKSSGFSLLKLVNNVGEEIEYFDKIGEVKKEDFTSRIADFSLNPNTLSDNQKKVTSIAGPKKDALRSEWLKGSYFHQPAYRYEEPFWKNDPFLDTVRLEDKKRFSGQLDKELEIISSNKENKGFLLDLVLDRFVQSANPLNVVLWENIKIILGKILKNNKVRFGIGPRGGHRISIMEDLEEKNSRQFLPSIDNLSLGESVLLNLFVNVIRHSGNQTIPLEQIEGIVAIDEIDVHLHTDLQNSVLPELIQIFPKVQFVITTHSPLFLLGMQKVFGDSGFEIRNMPDGSQITAERFSEFENAYNVFKNTSIFEESLKNRIVKENKPIIYVEGPTDVQYIQKAYDLFAVERKHLDIQIIGKQTENGTKNSNNKMLSNAEKLLSVNLNLLKQKVILLNDPEESITTKEYDDLLYVCQIPFQTNTPLKKGIENLFKEDLIQKVQAQFSNDFSYLVKGGKNENLKIDSNKQTICDWICTNGTKEDFENFEPILKLIETIIPTPPTEQTTEETHIHS
jgi:predicted ATPase/5S rRNA maturation endonuclease (ribonuclease M5)